MSQKPTSSRVAVVKRWQSLSQPGVVSGAGTGCEKQGYPAHGGRNTGHDDGAKPRAGGAQNGVANVGA